MSDSEGEFESADEGTKDDDGWDIESDVEFPNVDSEQLETKLSTLPSVSDVVDAEHSVQHKSEVSKPSAQINKLDALPTLKSKLDEMALNSVNKNSEPQISVDSKCGQNEIKTTTQSSVSNNFSIDSKYLNKGVWVHTLIF